MQKPIRNLNDSPPLPKRKRARSYSDAEKHEALLILGECGGNLSRAARRLNMDVSLLWRWRERAIRGSDR
jgi:transposase-like protein